MATAIKQIPVLKGKEASAFVKKADKNLQEKHTVDFSKQAKNAQLILAKAKI